MKQPRLLVVYAALSLSLSLGLAGCAATVKRIPGTRVEDTTDNRDILAAVEKYRVAVEQKDISALAHMASTAYWEDAGTPDGTDDYGYKELKDVLAGRFQQASSIRFSLRYMNIRRHDNKAWVDVLMDLSWTIGDAHGRAVRKGKRDQGQLVLELDGDDWRFLSGM